jgi:hypothetical protein
MKLLNLSNFFNQYGLVESFTFYGGGGGGGNNKQLHLVLTQA